jgi:competence protein ComEC
LWPGIEFEEVTHAAKNDDSLVLRLGMGNMNILLPGDAEKRAEQEILKENSGEALQSDILKVGHPGSKNSTTPEFLAAVHARIGIISVGETNPHGHPSPELLERLEGAGVRILRTDRDGAVHVLTDGQRLEISCFAGCPAVAATAASAQTEIHNRKQGTKN